MAPPLILRPKAGLPAFITRWVIAAVCLVLAVLLSQTLLTSAFSVQGLRFWRGSHFRWFMFGTLAWPILFSFARSTLLYWYVLGHELTHVAAVLLCGGKVQGAIRVSAQGGHIVTNKSNAFISLSPYCVPFYCVIVALSFGIAALLMDINEVHVLSLGGVAIPFRLIYLLFAGMGLTWAMHGHLTIKMILKDQPDLRMNGTPLSLCIIYLCNVGVLSLLLILATPFISFRSFLQVGEDQVLGWARFFHLILTRSI